MGHGNSLLIYLNPCKLFHIAISVICAVALFCCGYAIEIDSAFAFRNSSCSLLCPCAFPISSLLKLQKLPLQQAEADYSAVTTEI